MPRQGIPDHDELDGALPSPEPEADESPDDDHDEDDDSADTDRPVERDAQGRPLVRLGDRTVALGVPSSPSACMEVVSALGVNALRAYSAALGMCWLAGPTPSPPRARPEQCGYSVMVYGGRVYDELFRAGVSPADIMAAGAVAYQHLLDSQVQAQTLRAAEDFSGARGARSPRRSSTSSAPGRSTRGG